MSEFEPDAWSRVSRVRSAPLARSSVATVTYAACHVSSPDCWPRENAPPQPWLTAEPSLKRDVGTLRVPDEVESRSQLSQPTARTGRLPPESFWTALLPESSDRFESPSERTVELSGVVYQVVSDARSLV